MPLIGNVEIGQNVVNREHKQEFAKMRTIVEQVTTSHQKQYFVPLHVTQIGNVALGRNVRVTYKQEVVLIQISVEHVIMNRQFCNLVFLFRSAPQIGNVKLGETVKSGNNQEAAQIQISVIHMLERQNFRSLVFLHVPLIGNVLDGPVVFLENKQEPA